MGQGQLLAAAAALTFASLIPVAASTAQGPVYREQWGYMHLEHRRLEVLHELARRDEATIAKVAELLAEPDSGMPFAPLAKALALLRSVTADDAFVLRTSMGAFVLPEVCDPDGQKEECRSLNVSLFLPFAMTMPGKIEFDLSAKDAKGQEVWTHHVDRETSLADLRMARATASLSGADLPDGTYSMTVATRIDGKALAASDPVLSWPFHVLRGYQARAEAALLAARDATPGLAGTEQALFGGFVHDVGRAYTGEPFVVASDGVRDLERLEQALQAVAAHRPVMSSTAGEVTTELPGAGGEPMECVLRLHPGEQPRPLVVFVTSTPVYDLTAKRPTAPGTRHPGWAASELSGFAAHRDWNVAFFDSPGAGRDFFATLQAALASLTSLLPASEQKPLLVCDREAAAVIAFHLADLRRALSGVVLVGAGAMPASTLQAIEDLPVRYVLLHGHPSSVAVTRVLDYIGHQESEGVWHGDVKLLTHRAMPWPFAVPLLQTEIEAFAVERFAH